MNKKDLLSIGMLSKLTGVHIKSLRYYDQLGILVPVYVDDFTSYRYYSVTQIQYVIAIQFCVELGIPLKDFSSYTSDNQKILYGKLVATGTLIAEKKIEAIHEKLNLLKAVQKEIERAEECLNSEEPIIYELPEKLCWITPFDGIIGSDSYNEKVNNSVLKINKQGLKIGYEMGIINICKGNLFNRYIFIDIASANLGDTNDENLYRIDKSEYLCKKMDENIEFSPLHGTFPSKFDNIIIEIDLFTGEYNVENSKYEIRYKLG